jgi:hypothetical protein
VNGVWFGINGTNYSYSGNSSGEYYYYLDCQVFGSGYWFWNITWGSDGSGNLNYTVGEGLPLGVVCDVDNPSVENAQVNVSSPVDVGTPVKVNASVSDPNLDTVLIEVIRPDMSTENLSTSNSGDEYYAEYTLYTTGNFSFRFYTNDSLGYENYSVYAIALDSYTNVTVQDLSPPLWQGLGANMSTMFNNQSVNLYAEGYDGIGLWEAFLGTNESGAWVNHSGVYDSPLGLGNTTSWAYSNFTWYNESFIGELWFEIWYRDNSSNWNVTGRYSVTVKDSNLPEISLQSPGDNTWNSSLTVQFAYLPATNDDFTGCYLWTNESGWSLKEYNATGVVNDSVNYITETFGSDSLYVWAIQCNDSSGNYNISSNRTVRIDSTYPSMVIYHPQNTTYNVTGLWLNFTFTEQNNDTCWYDYNGANNTLSGCGNTSFSGLDNQQSEVFLWINDSAGNLNSSSVAFAVDTLNPNYTAVGGDTSGDIGEGDFATASVYWDDNLGMNYSVVRTNKSGSYTNEGVRYFSSASGWSNISIDTTGHYGELICWVQWGVDEGGNWNTSMSEDVYCFNVTSGVQKRSIYCEDCTSCSAGCSLTDSQCQDAPDAVQSFASGEWAGDSITWDFIMENASRTGEFKYANLTIYDFRASSDQDDPSMFQYSADDGQTWTTLETWTENTYPTSNTNRTYSVPLVDSWSAVNQTMFRIAGGSKSGQAETWTWYVDAVELRLSYDDTPPTYSQEWDNSTGGVYHGDDVKVSVQWYDLSSDLDTAIMRTNESGTWENRSYYSFSSKPEYANFTINTTGHAGETICWVQWANDTAGNLNGSMGVGEHCFDVPRPYLEVNLILPIDNENVANNVTFTVNGTVICRDSDCGNVSGRVMYNASSQDPDTDIPTSVSQPFYITDATNPLNCSSNPMAMDEVCNFTWSVNATGDVGSSYEIGILFESVESYVYSNNTDNRTVNIISCIIDITVNYAGIDFGGLSPGERGNASGNDNDEYNTTIEDTTTCNIDLYLRSDNLTRKLGGGYQIDAENLSFSNTTNEYNNGYSLSNSWVLGKSQASPDQNVTAYYWIDMPFSLMEGEYNGTLYIEAVEQGDLP